MTITLNVRVNGNYRARVTPQVDGQPAGETVIVDGPSGDTQIYFQHGSVNTFRIEEEPLTQALQEEREDVESAALDGTGTTDDDLDGLDQDSP